MSEAKYCAEVHLSGKGTRNSPHKLVLQVYTGDHWSQPIMLVTPGPGYSSQTHRERRFINDLADCINQHMNLLKYEEDRPKLS